VNLEERTFNTFRFYSEHQDSLTPAGLAFFQSDYDHTLRNFFHNVLNMKVIVPDPYDPSVLGPPGSGSVIICTDPDLDLGSSINKQNNYKKTLISTVL
jgi:hypothetical protein